MRRTTSYAAFAVLELLRKACGLNVRELSLVLGIAESTVSLIRGTLDKGITAQVSADNDINVQIALRILSTGLREMLLPMRAGDKDTKMAILIHQRSQLLHRLSTSREVPSEHLLAVEELLTLADTFTTSLIHTSQSQS